MDRREFLKLSLMAGLGVMFGPQLLAATKEKLIITDWLHFEFAGELQPSTVTVLQQIISHEIKEYLTLHPTHKLVTITNQWASETGKRVTPSPEQIREWKIFYGYEKGKRSPLLFDYPEIELRQQGLMAQATIREQLSEPEGIVQYKIRYAIHNPDRAHLITEDMCPDETTI